MRCVGGCLVSTIDNEWDQYGVASPTSAAKESCVCRRTQIRSALMKQGYGKDISYNNICVHGTIITTAAVHSWFARFEPEFVLNNQVTTCV